MHPKYRYQILLFGNKTHLFNSIQEIFYKKIEELRLDKDSFVFFINEKSIGYKGNQPAFCVFSNSCIDIDAQLIPFIEKQKNDGNAILPLYTENFTQEVNEILSDYNGMKLTEGLESVVNHILEGFDLLRRRRKLFISYRQSDSRSIAIQIFDWFESLNYDVFLDTHSVPKAALFQQHLWHQMSDSDIVILLDSKDFLQSEWCEKELTFAENKRIAILRIKFPDSSISDDNAGILSTVRLEPISFNDGTMLSKEKLTEISQEVESLRARALASRQDSLITELIETARLYKREIIRFDQNILRLRINETHKAEDYLFVPAIGVPQSLDFHNIDTKFQEAISNAKDIFLIYDDSSLLKFWNNHIQWLNSQLKVHSLNRSKFPDFFKNLK